MLAAGGVVALPTETVYGLAVEYDNEKAVRKLIKIKDRAPESGKVFALMLADVSQIKKYAVIDGIARDVVRRHLPGELTLVLPRRLDFRNSYYDKFYTIGIRIPIDPWLRGLLLRSGPLIVTSANLRGEPPAESGDEVRASLLELDAVVAGVSGGQPPTTVAEVRDGEVRILRQGGLKLAEVDLSKTQK